MSQLDTTANAQMQLLLLPQDKKNQIVEFLEAEFEEGSTLLNVNLVGEQLTMSISKNEVRSIVINTSGILIDAYVNIKNQV